MKETLEKMISLMQNTAILEKEITETIALRKRLTENELIVSVVGQFKRGKSSLINAIIEESLLPVGIIPITTVITEIRHGNQFKAVVCYADGTTQEIGRHDLCEYISEQKNYNNHKNVAVVKIWVTNKLFGEGITLVDTPGVGSIHQENTNISYSYIEKSDAILFLLSVDSPVSELEQEFLLSTSKHASKFYFAVNKIDTITLENQSQFISYCKSILSNTVKSNVQIYPISCETNHGISKLVQTISEDLHTNQSKLLNDSITIKMNNIIKQTNSKIDLFLKAVEMPAVELKIKIAQLKEKQLSLNTLSDEVEVLTKRQTDKLIDEIKDAIEEKISDVIYQIQAEGNQVYNDNKSLSSRQFEVYIKKRMECKLRQKIEEVNVFGLSRLKNGYEIIVQSLNQKKRNMALYLSEMIKTHFDVDFHLNTSEHLISERTDYYVQLSSNGSIYLDFSSFIHLFPRRKANKMIFERTMKQTIHDFELNKNNMLYNYRYKMQESLRFLRRNFTSDIVEMNSELTRLFSYIKEEQSTESKHFNNTKDRYQEISDQLKKISNSKV